MNKGLSLKNKFVLIMGIILSLTFTINPAFAGIPSEDSPPYNVDVIKFNINYEENKIELVVKNTGENQEVGKFYVEISEVIGFERNTIFTKQVDLEIDEEEKIIKRYNPSYFSEFAKLNVTIKPSIQSTSHNPHTFVDKDLHFSPMNFVVPIAHEVKQKGDTYEVNLDLDKSMRKGLILIQHENLDQYCPSFHFVSGTEPVAIDSTKNETMLKIEHFSQLKFQCNQLNLLTPKAFQFLMAYAEPTVFEYLEDNINFFYEDSNNYMVCQSSEQCFDLTRPIVEKPTDIPNDELSLKDFLFPILATSFVTVGIIGYLKFASKPKLGKVKPII